MVRFDDEKLSLDSEYSNRVISDASVMEHFWPDFTLEQFRKLAFAKYVYVKIGYKNYEILPSDRLKWRLLCKYYEFKLEDQSFDLNNALSEKKN